VLVICVHEPEGQTLHAYSDDRPDQVLTADQVLSLPQFQADFHIGSVGCSRGEARREPPLGQFGEEVAVEVESRRLLSLGRDDLAAKVERLAHTCGDGVGFDVLSFGGPTGARGRSR